jgi:hypothetical protein
MIQKILIIFCGSTRRRRYIDNTNASTTAGARAIDIVQKVFGHGLAHAHASDIDNIMVRIPGEFEYIYIYNQCLKLIDIYCIYQRARARMRVSARIYLI